MAELYTGDLFKKSRAYAKTFDAWFILSAKLGLARPETIVAPYDATLTTATRQEKTRWAGKVLTQFVAMYPYPKGICVTFLAGKNYRDPLADLLLGHGVDSVEFPMAGLGIGQQLAWLKERTQ